MNDRLHPYDAERRVLGAVLLTALSRDCDPWWPELGVGHFDHGPHAAIWRACLTVRARGELPSLEPVWHELRQTLSRGGLDLAYLVELVDAVPLWGPVVRRRVERDVGRLEQAIAARRLVDVCERAAACARVTDEPLWDIVARLERELGAVRVLAGDVDRDDTGRADGR